MKLKATHHIGVRTQNMAAMEKFYTETLGFPVTRRWDDVQIIFIDIGSTTIELIGRAEAPAANAPVGCIDHIALQVENLDAAYQELVEKGVKIKVEPRNFKDVRICFFYDPDGNSLELVQELGA
ncbi:MAG: VOC family protein [Caldilineaceae bacterium]|nr:VOC family protein [Caldilineaceae bacterium]